MANPFLTEWLVAAMMAWTTGRSPAREPYVRTVADAVLDVALDPAEPPLFSGPQGRARTALLLAAVAAKESGLDPRIQAGRCAPGECDGGAAHCLMQIHPGAGIVLVGDGWGYARAGTPREEVYRGRDLTADLGACFRVGTHMLRTALRRSGGATIAAYTGELGPAPKAAERLRLAETRVAMFPPPADP